MSDSPAPHPGPREPAPRSLQVPLWDWPVEGAQDAASAPAVPAPAALAQAPVVIGVRETEPAVDEALGVIRTTLDSMAATETRPLLDEPVWRHRLRRIGD